MEKSDFALQRVPFYLGVILEIPSLLGRPVEHWISALLLSRRMTRAVLWQPLLKHFVTFVDLIGRFTYVFKFMDVTSPETW